MSNAISPRSPKGIGKFMMDSRRRWSNETLLPLRPIRKLSHSVTCCYCDFKFFAFNEPLFRLGRNHSRLLRVWFSVGVGFTLSALLGSTLILLFEPLLDLDLFSLVSSLTPISLPNMGYLCISSVVSVAVHEIGHALAAAVEGVPPEYVAVFWAVLFPGALVAFNHESLKSLPGPASLRIYCAGIWHNAVFCTICFLSLLLLPCALSPFYVHGSGPIVLDVPRLSPLSGYLLPGDVIFSLDGFPVRTAEDWRQVAVISNVKKGYCVPLSLIEESENQTICRDEVIAFQSVVTCNEYTRDKNITYCLDAKDVIKLKKCGFSRNNKSDCLCSELESCIEPVQVTGQGWVEITYSRSSLQCHSNNTCVETFVFIGDLVSMAHSITLTSYQPRWSINLGKSFPNVLEKLLTSGFHVSVVLALLNSLPVYFLDGESILEGALSYFGCLSRKMKRLVLQCCLFSGTFILTCFVVRAVFVSVG